MQELGYEMHIDCTGSKFLGPRLYLKGEIIECIDPQTGQINVNENLQATSTSDNSRTFCNIFSLGDVCLTPAKEEKSVVPIKLMSKVLSHNLYTLLSNS